MILIAVYLLIGIGLAFGRATEIAADACDRNRVVVAASWVITWPAWAFK